MKFALKFLAASMMLAAAGGAFAQKGETVKIAMIEGLSGPFANVGQNQLKSWQFVAEHLTPEENPAGVKFEITGMDSKGSPQESLNLLKSATDQGYRYIMQGMVRTSQCRSPTRSASTTSAIPARRCSTSRRPTRRPS